MGLLKSLLARMSTETPNEDSGWLQSYVDVLNGRLRRPADSNEVGIIDGTSDDGRAWTLRVLSRRGPDSESSTEYHHLLWHTDSVRIAEVQLVFGSAASDRALWSGLDGLNVQASDIERGMEQALSALERLVESGAEAGEFMKGLGRLGQSAMVSFVERAKPFALPEPLTTPWHGLTLDADLPARVFTTDVVKRLNACEAIQDFAGGWLRVWIGGPNVRLEAMAVDPAPDSYQHLVDAGLTLARIVRDAAAPPHSIT